MRTATLTWISIALLLPSLTAWGAEVCHNPFSWAYSIGSAVQQGSIQASNTKSVVAIDFITKDVEKVDAERSPTSGFNTYMHPFGETRVETTSTAFIAKSPPQTSVDKFSFPSPVFEDCCTCGDNENAAYRLKIFSKHQDPTKGERFDKPILVTQGFDAKYRTADQFSFHEFEEILNTVYDTDDTTKTAPDTVGLLRTLYDEGYDIALLLWKNPLIAIRTNALVTLQALRWLEGHTVPGSGTEPVIIGPSMGGLVTRYALQLAGGELGFPLPGIRARLFIAFDSPNRGAEVPMSLQALASHFRDRDEDQRQTFLNLTSVAARQLLLSSVHDLPLFPCLGSPFGECLLQIIGNYELAISDPLNQNGFAHGSFIADINNPNRRAQIKNIVHPVPSAGRQEPIYTAAIINGSGIGLDMGYSPGCRYASATSILTPNIRLGMTDPGRLNFVFDTTLLGGRSGTSVQYSFQEPAFVENAPGGYRDTYKPSIQALRDQFGKFLETHDCFTLARYTENHAFIPSLSGAGLPRDINFNESWYTPIGSLTTFRDGSVGIQVGCQGASPLCMFDEVRAPARNQRHVTVTRQNKEWFLELIHTYGPQGPPPPGACFGFTLLTKFPDGVGILIGNGSGSDKGNQTLKIRNKTKNVEKEIGTILVDNDGNFRVSLDKTITDGLKLDVADEVIVTVGTKSCETKVVAAIP